MTKENAPTIQLGFEIDPFDLIADIARCLTPEEVMAFIRQLDSEMESWEMSEMIIVYGKELEAMRIEFGNELEAMRTKEKTENSLPLYAYWAKNADGTDVKGQKKAASVGALVANLKRQGLIVINVEKTEE